MLKLISGSDIDATAKIMDFVNLYGCKIGKECFVGPFVEIQKDSVVGDFSKISSHSFICEGVTIMENCFIGHGVTFTNDKFDSDRPNEGDYILRKTKIERNVRIGSNSTILPVTIGENSIIGAGSVVTKDVPANTVVSGNPAKFMYSR